MKSDLRTTEKYLRWALKWVEQLTFYDNPSTSTLLLKATLVKDIESALAAAKRL